MKLAASFNSKFLRLSPKRIFRSKSKASVSRSDPSSFSSNASSSSSDGSYDNNLKPGPSATPISVLPQNSGDFYTELIQAFKLIDRDDDGVVSRGDLAALLSSLSPEPPSEEEVTLMLREVDGGRGEDEGCISLEELASRVAETSGEGSEETAIFSRSFDSSVPLEEPPSYRGVALGGVATGAVQSLLLTPVELIKIRLQLQQSNCGPISLAKTILRREGLKGIYKGLTN